MANPAIAQRVKLLGQYVTYDRQMMDSRAQVLAEGQVINEVAGVSRLVYDISGKPPATIEWE